MIITLRIIRHLKSMVLIKGSAELLWKTFAAILDRKHSRPVLCPGRQRQMKELTSIDKAVLDAVLNQGLKQHRRDLKFSQRLIEGKLNIQFLREAKLHDFQIIADKINFFFQRNQFPVQIAHKAIIG